MCGVFNALLLSIKGEILTISSISFVEHISRIHVRVVAFGEKAAFLLQIIETKDLLS